MHITVKTPSGKPLELVVFRRDTISAVKHAIYQKEGFVPIRQRLMYAGKILADESTLRTYGIWPSDTLHLVSINGSPTTKPSSPPPAVFIKTLSGQVFRIEAGPDATVSYLKHQIWIQHPVPVYQQRLAFAGKQLDDGGHTLSSYNIQPNDTIHLISTQGPLEMASSSSPVAFIRILTGGRIFRIEAGPNDTISYVKHKIWVKEDLSVDQQRLNFSGKLLEDDRTLSSYNIQPNSTLHLMATL